MAVLSDDAGGVPLLELEDVEVAYGGASLALRGISVRVDEHQAVAVLGPNGAGKTTMIRAITGLLGVHGGRIVNGTVRLEGKDVSTLTPHQIVATGVAQVPEGRMVFKTLSVEDNLRAGAASGRVKDPDVVLEEIFGMFPVLRERRDDQAGWMSGGEQQMIAIGRALMAGPRLLILDEASLGLAPLITKSIFATLSGIRERLGLAVLLNEQNTRLALDFADRAYVMENGRIVLEGDSASLKDKPEVQASYLGIDVPDETPAAPTAPGATVTTPRTGSPFRARTRTRWLA